MTVQLTKVDSRELVEVAELIRTEQDFVVISHHNPDFDAYGSSAAITYLLKQNGKNAVCLNQDGFLPRYKFATAPETVYATLDEALAHSNFRQPDNAVLVVCDCGDRKRVGDKMVGLLTRFKKIINIDHHGSNDSFGTHNFVVSAATSTCELMYYLAVELGWGIDARAASMLYAGLVADTGSFRYSNTSKATFELAAQLVGFGAVPHEVANAIFSSNSLSSVKVHSLALSKLELFGAGQVAVSALSLQDKTSIGATADDTEGLIERIRDIEGVVIAAMIVGDNSLERGNFLRVSLRAKETKVDVAKIAASYGGGGHRAAAGFRTSLTAEELKPALVQALISALSGAN